MKNAFIVAAASLTVLLSAMSARADGPIRPLAIEAAVGANICIENDRAGCGGVDPFVYGRIGVHYRLLRNLALGIDIDAGAFSTDNDGDGYLGLHVTAGVRGLYHIVPRFRVFSGVGLGFGHLRTSYSPPISGVKAVTVNAFSIKVPLGLKVAVVKHFWLGLEAAVHVHLTGDECVKTDGPNLCADVGSDDVIHNLQVGLILAYHL